MPCSQDSTTKGARAALLVLAMAALAVPAEATILTFDQVRIGGAVVPTVSGNPVPQDYGDRVAAETMPASGGTFTYGEGGEGFTPSVEVEYFGGSATAITSAASLWSDGYGTLENVLFGNQASSTLNVRFTADPGIDVFLHGFELAGWPTTDYTIAAVRVSSGAQLLYEALDVLVLGAGSGAGRTTFAFGTPLAAGTLLLSLDYSNLAAGQQDNIGLDDVRFGQTALPDDDNGDNGDDDPPASVPEPGALALCAIALAAALRGRRRSFLL